MPKEVRKQVKKDLHIGADEMVDLAQRLVRRDKGGLKSSIRKEKGNHSLSITVKAGGPSTTKEVRNGSGVEYDYALAEEYSTQVSSGQPFFWPAYRLTKRKRSSRVTRNANKAIKKLFTQ